MRVRAYSGADRTENSSAIDPLCRDTSVARNTNSARCFTVIRHKNTLHLLLLLTNSMVIVIHLIKKFLAIVEPEFSLPPRDPTVSQFNPFQCCPPIYARFPLSIPTKQTELLLAYSNSKLENNGDEMSSCFLSVIIGSKPEKYLHCRSLWPRGLRRMS